MDNERGQSNIVIVPIILITTVVVSLLVYICYIYKKRRENGRLSITGSEDLRRQAMDIHIVRCNVN